MSDLTVTNLTKDFVLRNGFRSTKLHAVKDVSFDLRAGRTLALVGQSGSGKSTVARMIARLEKPTSGSILLDGRALSSRGSQGRAYRDDVQMVFQDPFASLNPFHTVEHHITRALLLHGGSRANNVRQDVEILLERVSLTPGRDFLQKRPHELSGGQRQRVAIARALAPRPSVLIADEPVSMLDVSVRLDVLNLLARLQQEEHLALLYITHDLATARHFSDEIVVMLNGEVVERGDADEVILHPKADFTKRLLAAAPEPSRNRRLQDSAGLSGRSIRDH